jgi:hypothetical protein
MREHYPKFKASNVTKVKTFFTPSVSYDYLFGPVFDQGQEGSCVSNGSAALMLAYRSKRQHEILMPSRRAIYTQALLNNDEPLEDSGLNVSDGLTVCEAGYIPEALWPYTGIGTPTFFDTPPASLWRSDFHLTNYATVAPDVLSMQRALVAHGPIIIGIAFANEWMNTGEDGILIGDPTQLTVDGGHCMVITGYKSIGGVVHFRVRNSWGAAWADNGYCWLPATLAGSQFWPTDLFVVQA